MSAPDERFTSGPWHLCGQRAEFARLAPELARHAAARTKWRAWLPRAEGELFAKGSPLAAWPALRHALRRTLLRRAEPRLCELANLRWLAAHGFGAPEPVLAGVLRAHGLPRYQFLVTRAVAAPRLDELFARAPAAERLAAAAALGRTLARLHALGFVHRDLFARNLLLAPGPSGPQVVFLDSWRGGPRRGLRGPLHDLACLMLDGASLLAADEQRRLFAAYREASPRACAPDLEAAVARARARLLPRERRRHPELLPDWNFPGSE